MANAQDRNRICVDRGAPGMSLQACADLVRRADPDRFLATMACPPAARRILFPFYAFNVEVSRAPWVTSESMIAEMRLQFWRDAVADIGAGHSPRAHDVSSALADVLRPEDAPLLDALIAARRWDVYRDPFQDQADFDAYITATAANLVWATARALGAPEAAETPVRDYAGAMGTATFLRAIAELQRRERTPLIDATPQQVHDMATQGLAMVQRARDMRRQVPRAVGYALYAGWQTEVFLKIARNDPARVFDGTLAQSEFRRRISLLTLSITGRW